MIGLRTILFLFRNQLVLVSPKDFAISDCRIGFYVKNCVYSQLETSEQVWSIHVKNSFHKNKQSKIVHGVIICLRAVLKK